MKIAAIIIVCVAAGLLLLWVIFKIVLTTIRRQLVRVISETFKREEIIMGSVNANYFGLESLGGRQLRGNCALVLTRDVLWSCRAVPRRELPIPVQRIEKVSLVKSHCGRALFVDLLRVDFEAADSRDAVAWYVREPKKWKAAIEALKNTQQEPDAD